MCKENFISHTRFLWSQLLPNYVNFGWTKSLHLVRSSSVWVKESLTHVNSSPTFRSLWIWDKHIFKKNETNKSTSKEKQIHTVAKQWHDWLQFSPSLREVLSNCKTNKSLTILFLRQRPKVQRNKKWWDKLIVAKDHCSLSLVVR